MLPEPLVCAKGPQSLWGNAMSLSSRSPTLCPLGGQSVNCDPREAWALVSHPSFQCDDNRSPNSTKPQFSHV